MPDDATPAVSTAGATPQGQMVAAHWARLSLTVDGAMQTLQAQGIAPEQATTFVRRVVEGFDHLRTRLDQIVVDRGETLLAAHQRVRSAARATGVRYRVEPQLPGDILGAYVFVPSI